MEDSQWYEKTLEKGFRIDLRGYQNKTPYPSHQKADTKTEQLSKGGGRATGRDVNPAPAPAPAPAAEPVDRCRLCGNNPDRQDQTHKCNLVARTCSMQSHPDLRGHTLERRLPKR
jgi:hypothetical protein